MPSRRIALALIVVLVGAPLVVLILHFVAPSKPSVTVGASKFEVDVVSTREGRRTVLPLRSRVRPFEPLLWYEARPRFLHVSPQGVARRLDVVFLDASWKIVDAGLVAPGNDEGVTSAKEAAAALILDSGDWAKTGAKIGDTVSVPDVVKKIQPEERVALTFEGLAATAYVELALTEDERRRGLMWRERMSEDDGMLFKYTPDTYKTLMDAGHTPGHWMKNTRLPLSIAYAKQDGTIDTIHEFMKPLDEHNYPAKGEWMYALEMNKDWFEKRGVREGDKIVFSKEIRDAPAEE